MYVVVYLVYIYIHIYIFSLYLPSFSACFGSLGPSAPYEATVYLIDSTVFTFWIPILARNVVVKCM